MVFGSSLESTVGRSSGVNRTCRNLNDDAACLSDPILRAPCPIHRIVRFSLFEPRNALFDPVSMRGRGMIYSACKCKSTRNAKHSTPKVNIGQGPNRRRATDRYGFYYSRINLLVSAEMRWANESMKVAPFVQLIGHFDSSIRSAWHSSIRNGDSCLLTLACLLTLVVDF